ncbi:hypothetical protein VIMY103929_11365 [Vibrio mytili]|uniref:hypothetical protein n=1 Tax=Vibrio mytili TaxID=50718 RepID=UPI0039E7C7F7
MYNFLSSGAFVETFTIEPYSSGSLNGLKFAIKDNIDIAPEFNCEVRHSSISSSQCHFFKYNRWLLEA